MFGVGVSVFVGVFQCKPSSVLSNFLYDWTTKYTSNWSS